MIGASVIHALRPGRSNTTSSNSSIPYFEDSAPSTSTETEFAPYPVAQQTNARASIDSESSYDDEVPPPTYEDVVSDENYKPHRLSGVRHHEDYRKKQRRSHSIVRFHDYGVYHSKIYVKE